MTDDNLALTQKSFEIPAQFFQLCQPYKGNCATSATYILYARDISKLIKRKRKKVLSVKRSNEQNENSLQISQTTWFDSTWFDATRLDLCNSL